MGKKVVKILQVKVKFLCNVNTLRMDGCLLMTMSIQNDYQEAPENVTKTQEAIVADFR